MDCEKIRDRFSSLWERELPPFEEKTVKQHLSSCPECRSEFEKFEKTMRWLHSVGEVEVPDEFLPGLYKKIEERKRTTPAEKSGKRWLNFPVHLKLPVQAVAMVAIVFLVLYLTKMMPQPPVPLSVGKKSEQTLARSAAPSPISGGEAAKRRSGSTLSEPSPLGRGVEGLAQKELERGRVAMKTSPEVPRPIDVQQAKDSTPKGGQLEEASVVQLKAEKKKSEASAQSTEVLVDQAVESKKAARAEVPSSNLGKSEKGQFALEKSLVASKPPREIVLKTSNRDKAASKLNELVKQFGGEIVATEGDRFLASFPAASFLKFEKELAEVTDSTRADKASLFLREPDTGDSMARHRVMKEEIDKESGEPAKSVTDEESRIVVRILLIQE